MPKKQKTFFLEGTRIPLMVTDYDWTFAEMHWHNFWEILLPKEGRTEITVGRETWHTGPGEIILIPPNIMHETRCVSDAHKILLLQFRTAILEPVMRLDIERKYLALLINGGYQVRNKISGQDQRLLSPLLEQILEENQDKKIGCEFGIYARILQIFSFFLERQYIVLDQLSESRKRALLEVSPSLRHLDEYFMETITLHDLAEMCYLSDAYFSKQFKKALGINMTAYLNRLRLNEAVRLLQTGNQSITEISMQVGYSSVNYFNRVFRQTYKMSPRVWRAQGEE